MPASNEKAAIAAVLKEEGYIGDFAVSGEGAKRTLGIEIKYYGGKPVIAGLERVSKPSCRVHCGCAEIPRVRNGLGIVVLSTPKGIISGRKAKAENVGGEIICYVW
jgi:small subunit ribosomal protein S8